MCDGSMNVFAYNRTLSTGDARRMRVGQRLGAFVFRPSREARTARPWVARAFRLERLAELRAEASEAAGGLA